MAETTRHAPTPWKIEYSTTGSGQVIGMTDANGRDIRASAIGSTTAAEGSRTSEMIFRAVNAHDDLVAALKQCRSELEEASKLLAGNGLNGMASIYAQAAERVIAALAKAEGAPLDLSTAVEG